MDFCIFLFSNVRTNYLAFGMIKKGLLLVYVWPYGQVNTLNLARYGTVRLNIQTLICIPFGAVQQNRVIATEQATITSDGMSGCSKSILSFISMEHKLFEMYMHSGILGLYHSNQIHTLNLAIE